MHDLVEATTQPLLNKDVSLSCQWHAVGACWYTIDLIESCTRCVFNPKQRDRKSVV